MALLRAFLLARTRSLLVTALGRQKIFIARLWTSKDTFLFFRRVERRMVLSSAGKKRSMSPGPGCSEMHGRRTCQQLAFVTSFTYAVTLHKGIETGHQTVTWLVNCVNVVLRLPPVVEIASAFAETPEKKTAFLLFPPSPADLEKLASPSSREQLLRGVQIRDGAAHNLKLQQARQIGHQQD